MIKLSKQIFSINVLVLFSACCLCIGTTCVNIFNNQGLEAIGGIYGFLKIELFGKILPPTLAKVYVEGTNLFSSPDSTGIFYFPKIKVGRYTLIGRAAEFADYVVESVEVAEDSISIVSIASLVEQSFPEKHVWDGIKIKRVNVRRKGSMAGRVYDSHTGEHVAGAYVIIRGTFWGTVTDSSGNYRINNILLGKYTAFSSGHVSYHRTVISRVRVASDSTSLVDFGLRPEGIPEEPLPREWEEKFIKP